MKEKRVMLQFKAGVAFCKRIAEAAEAKGVSRNAWVVAAAQHLLKQENPTRCETSASELFAQKKTLTCRVAPRIKTRIDQACQGKIDRTIWLLDACLSKLTTEEKK